MNTIYYVVEYRARDTGYWTEEELFKPEYKITKTISPRSFLFFTDAARTKALKMARALHDKDVRVMACRYRKGYEWWVTVWENGKFKDC